MNNDKEKIYSKAVGSGFLFGLASGIIFFGGLYAFHESEDYKTGIKIVLVGIALAIAAVLFAPSIDKINYLKGK